MAKNQSGRKAAKVEAGRGKAIYGHDHISDHSVADIQSTLKNEERRKRSFDTFSANRMNALNSAATRRLQSEVLQTLGED